MTAIVTPWDYTVDIDEGTSLPPLITATELRTLMPRLSSTDERLDAVLDNVSAAVRDYCGWHISPSLTCSFTGEGEGSLLMLPSMGVTAVNSLVMDGREISASDYWWKSSGMVKLKWCKFNLGWRNVECEYVAGFNAQAVAQAVAQIAANALVASPGVREEHAGSVGVTYNQTGSGITGGVSILARDMELLAPYKLTRA